MFNSEGQLTFSTEAAEARMIEAGDCQVCHHFPSGLQPVQQAGGRKKSAPGDGVRMVTLHHGHRSSTRRNHL